MSGFVAIRLSRQKNDGKRLLDLLPEEIGYSGNLPFPVTRWRKRSLRGVKSTFKGTLTGLRCLKRHFAGEVSAGMLLVKTACVPR